MLYQRFNTLSCLAVLLAVLAYSFADEAGGVAILGIVACAAAWWMGRTPPRPTLPRWAVNLLVFAAIARAAFLLLAPSPDMLLVSNLAQFLVFVQLIKLFDRRHPRDDAQLLSLSAFIAIGTVLTSNQLIPGIFLLAYVPVVVIAAMCWHVLAGTHAEAMARLGLEPSLIAPPNAELAAQQISTTDESTKHPRHKPPSVAAAITKLGLISAAATYTLAVVAFVVLPRGIGENVLGGFGQVAGPQRTTGFNDEVNLGVGGFINPSPEIVLEFTLRDAAGLNLGAENRTQRLRGVVLDRYENRRWTASRDAQDFQDPQDTPHPTLSTRLRRDRTIDFDIIHPDTTSAVPVFTDITIRDLAQHDGVLFTLWAPRSITAARSLELAQPIDQRLVIRTATTSGPVSYTVESALSFRAGADHPPRVMGFTAGPVHDIAWQIVRQLDIDTALLGIDNTVTRQVISAFSDHLQSTCTYTLSPAAPQAHEDPIEMFLFRTRAGHCEYFAAALAAMSQAIGVEARVVTGYLASEFNRATGRYIVRRADAHAWTEVRIAQDRWDNFDPTPPSAIAEIQRPRRGLLTSIRDWYNSVELGWTNSVVLFDASTRAALFGTATPQNQGPIGGIEGVREYFRDLRGSFPKLPSGLFPTLAAGAIIAIVLGRLFSKKNHFRRKHHTDTNHNTADPHIAASLATLLRALDRAGLPKPAGTHPLHHISHNARSQLQTTHQDAIELTNLYYRSRFGLHTITEQERLQARQWAENARIHLRKQHR